MHISRHINTAKNAYHMLFRHTNPDIRMRHKVRFLLRWLITPHISYEWWSLMLNLPYLAFTQKTPFLLTKPHRHYLSKYWNSAQRLEALKAHYTFTLPYKCLCLAHTLGFELLQFDIEQEQLSIKIETDPRYQREGELCLTLSYAKQRIYSLAFTFVQPSPDTLIAYIGSFQGGQLSETNLVKKITKSLYGLRPKALIFWAFQQLLQGIIQLSSPTINTCIILGVDDAFHVHNCYKFSNKKCPETYAAFWKELESSKQENGFWLIPLYETRKNREDIPSQKRASYEKRYAWLDECSIKIKERVKTRL